MYLSELGSPVDTLVECQSQCQVYWVRDWVGSHSLVSKDHESE